MQKLVLWKTLAQEPPHDDAAIASQLGIPVARVAELAAWLGGVRGKLDSEVFRSASLMDRSGMPCGVQLAAPDKKFPSFGAFMANTVSRLRMAYASQMWSEPSDFMLSSRSVICLWFALPADYGLLITLDPKASQSVVGRLRYNLKESLDAFPAKGDAKS